jgi:D-alanine transaminase
MKKWSESRTPAGRIAYVNGRYLPHGEAGVHIEDRGLQLSDSIYEVANVLNGKPVDEEPHLDRLERSLKEIGMAMPMGRVALKLVMREMIAKNRIHNGLLYLQVTRGAAKRDHVPPKEAPRPTLIITVRPQDSAALAARMQNGIAVATESDQRWARCDIKTVQLLPNLLARQAAKQKGAAEAWLVDGEGFITEAAAANAWIVDDKGEVVTRDLSRAILPGVTRAIILDAAREAGLKVTERKFSVAEAKKAREAFQSSASGAAVPVVSIDGSPVGDGKPGPLVRRIRELYAHKAGIQ